MTVGALVAGAVLGSYLVGGIPFGVIIGRIKGVDIRQAGSGNIGATNVGRLLGRRWGVITFFLDAAKGLIPTGTTGWLLTHHVAAEALSDSTLALYWLLAAFCTVLGHNFSPFLRLRGGKGVATSLGAALGIYPDLSQPALVALVLWIAVVGWSRISSLGSLTAAAAFPVIYVVLAWHRGDSPTGHWPYLMFSLLIATMLILRHRANVARLRMGTEARLEGSERSPSSS